MGITEAASRKIFLMKVRDHQAEYYYGIFYSPERGWQIARRLKDDLPAIWNDPEAVPCEELDYLEGERFVVCRIPCYIRGENKGNPKWEADEVLATRYTLTDAIAWIKRMIKKKGLEIIKAEPEVHDEEKN